MPLCSQNVVENETHIVLKCPLYNPITNQFLLQFENVMLGTLKSSFQLNHQVDISLYLKEATALCPFQRISWFETIITYFLIPSTFCFLDFKINFVSFQCSDRSVKLELTHNEEVRSQVARFLIGALDLTDMWFGKDQKANIIKTRV